MSRKDYKPKKKHKGLIIFLIIFSILVVFPVGFVFAAFFDTSTKQVSNSEVHFQNVVSESFYKGLKGLDSSHPKLSFTINEEMIDGIMMSACDMINQKQFIPKMYCTINGNDYTFIMDLQASFFKTRVLIYTNLDTEGEGFDRTLTFKITGVTVGRLPIPLNWVTGLMGKFINDETINNAFAQSGFHIKSHLALGKLTYSRSRFKEDVGAYIAGLGATGAEKKENPYLNLLLNMIGDKDHAVLSVNYKDGVTATFDFTQLELTKAPFDIDEPPLSFQDLDEHASQIEKWMNEKGLAEQDVDEMFTYLVRGYNNSSPDVRTFIQGIEGNELGVSVLTYLNNGQFEKNYSDLKSYDGSYINLGRTTHFADYCTDSIEGATFELDGEEATFTIDGDDINAYLAGAMYEGIGRTVPITFKDGNNKWNFTYVLVDNLFVNFLPDKSGNDPKMILCLTLNISGVQVSVTLANENITIDYAVKEPTPYLGDLIFDMKDKYFGAIPVTETSLLNDILVMLPTQDDKNDLFRYNKSNEQFLINLYKIISFQGGEEVKKNVIDLINGHKNDFVKSVPEGTNSFELKINAQ